jgi:ribonuclease P protein component
MRGAATSGRSIAGASRAEVAGVDRRMPRAVRLRSSNVFREVFGGRQVVGRQMVLWIRAREDDTVRLGVVASKRTFPKAVMRNRAKRLMREAFRLERHGLGGGGDLVLVGRRRLLSSGIVDVRREFRWLMRQAGLLAAHDQDRSGGRG